MSVAKENKIQFIPGKLSQKTGTIQTLNTRKASSSGKGMDVYDEKTEKTTRVNLPFQQWETSASGTVTASAFTGLKRSCEGNLVSWTATEDIKAGQEVLALCLVIVGDTESGRIQDDFAMMGIGALNASELAKRESREKLVGATRQAMRFLEHFSAKIVEGLLVDSKQIACSPELAKLAVKAAEKALKAKAKAKAKA